MYECIIVHNEFIFDTII